MVFRAEVGHYTKVDDNNLVKAPYNKRIIALDSEYHVTSNEVLSEVHSCKEFRLSAFLPDDPNREDQQKQDTQASKRQQGWDIAK